MSSQKGNASRSRSQKYQNATAYKNDKHGATAQVKKAKAKIHEGLCQHCKDVLEWKVQYNKYKPLTQPRKCVRCSQKTVKDAYHTMCKPCALLLQLCAKCGKEKAIVIPIDSHKEGGEGPEEHSGPENKGCGRRKVQSALDSDDGDDDDDLDFGSEDDSDDFDDDKGSKTTQSKTTALPNISSVSVKD